MRCGDVDVDFGVVRLYLGCDGTGTAAGGGDGFGGGDVTRLAVAALAPDVLVMEFAMFRRAIF